MALVGDQPVAAGGSSSASAATAVGSGSTGRPATTPNPPSAARAPRKAAASRSWRADDIRSSVDRARGVAGHPGPAPTDSVLALMLVVGLTGGIGSGKSTVSRLLGERGAVIVDADVAARRVVEPGGPAYQAVVDRFGPGILAPDGAIDRPALAAIVFSDPAARADLEDITHPAVGVLINEQLAAEAGDRPRGDPRRPPARGVGSQGYGRRHRRRLPARDRHRAPGGAAGHGRGGRPAAGRGPGQPAERLAHADLVIDNGGSPEALDRQVDAAWAWIQGLRAAAEL